MGKFIGSIRHVDLVVDSFGKSLPFYQDLLGLLGWKMQDNAVLDQKWVKGRNLIGERGEEIVYFAGPNGWNDGAIGIRERKTKKRSTPYDRYDIGLHHLAINAPTRKLVDDCAAWLRSKGWEIESGPEEYYGIDYYAVFFYDPDGIKLEIIAGGVDE